MSYIRDVIFTDAVKDVIGDEPVTDQSEVVNPASYYGTIHDSYVTGTLLSVSPQGAISIGERGSVFSKIYANEQPVPVSTYGSAEVNNNPSAAFRSVPWTERVNQQRSFFVLIDEKERIYDTCLPSLPAALQADGSSIWKISDVDPYLWLSPYGNVAHSQVGYIRFNDVAISHQGVSSDPLTNNDWTWSYPYEHKYSPETRLIDTKASLGLDATRLSTTWLPLPFNTLKVLTHPAPLKGVLPLLAGRTSRGFLGVGGRNGLRGNELMPTGSKDDTSTDSIYGTSYLIPSDVFLNTYVDHTSFGGSAPSPDTEYLTGSASQNDLLKILYGFGDNNSIGLVYNQLDVEMSSTLYRNDFRSLADSTLAGNISGVGSLTGSINWSNSIASSGIYQWRVVSKDGTRVGPDGISYNYISGTVEWVSGSSNKILVSETDPTYHGAQSNKEASTIRLDVTSSNPWAFAYNRAVAADTSDYLEVYFNRYKTEKEDSINLRRVIDYVQGDGGLLAASHVLQPFTSSVYPPGTFRINISYVKDDPLVRFEGLPDSVLTNTGIVNSILGVQQTTAQRLGSTAINAASSIQAANQTIGNSSLVASVLASPTAPAPVPQAVFAKASQTLAVQTRSSIGEIDRAFISEINLITWDAVSSPAVFDQESAVRVGCNNYPTFHKVVVDPRFCPIFSGTQAQKEETSRLYSSYNFGLAPIIRGWKYGLYSAIPTNTKAVFRNNRFGQFRDMLEQRIFTKSVNEKTFSPENAGVPSTNSIYEENEPGSPGDVSSAPVSVRFIRRRYRLDENSTNIGVIFHEVISPNMTLSHNTSTEVTSSRPYFDGTARDRDEASYAARNAQNFVVSAIDANGNTVIT